MPPDLPPDLDALAESIAARLADRLGAAQGYLSVAPAAEYTGLSTDSIRTMLSADCLTSLRPMPGRVVIDRRELDAGVPASGGKPAKRRRGRYQCTNG